jgi:phage/plasmid-associated DNA primase
VKQRILRHAVNSEADSKIEAMLRRLRRLDDLERGVNIPVDNRAFNPEPGLFNCRNGTIDLQTGELLPLSLPKTPSRQKWVILVTKWNWEVGTKNPGFADQMREGMMKRGSISNLDRIAPT